MTVKVPCHVALARRFHTVHLCLGAAAAVTAALSSPDGSARPNNGFRVRQVRMAQAPFSASRPRLPVGETAHVMAGSDKMVSRLLHWNAPLQADRFPVLQTWGM